MPKTFMLSAEPGLADALFPLAGRRASPRFRTIYADVRVERAGTVGLFRARNISDSGIMLNTHEAFDVGEHVVIGLSERLAIGGTVLWHNERCCGVQFDRPIDCAAVLRAGVEHKREDRRGGALRVAATKLATTYAENGIRAVKVVDVSHRGMGLAHDGTLGTGMLLRLVVESGIERTAAVRWSSDGRAGIRLLEPLSCEEVARVSGCDRRAPTSAPDRAEALEPAD